MKETQTLRKWAGVAQGWSGVPRGILSKEPETDMFEKKAKRKCAVRARGARMGRARATPLGVREQHDGAALLRRAQGLGGDLRDLVEALPLPGLHHGGGVEAQALARDPRGGQDGVVPVKDEKGLLAGGSRARPRRRRGGRGSCGALGYV